MLEEINQRIKHGKLDKALDLIESLNPHQQLQGKILKSKIYERTGKYQKALTLAEEVIETSKKQGRKIEEVGGLVVHAYALMRLKNFDQTKIQIRRAHDLLDSIDNKYLTKKQYRATLHNIEGLCHRYEGNLSEALNFYKKSLEIRSKLGIKEEVAASLSNIGTIYQMRGELDKALTNHIEALEYFVELDDDQYISYALHDIAGVYWERGNLEIAKNYFEKALNIRLSLDNIYNTMSTLFELILLNIESDYIEHAKYYFDILQEMYQNSNDPQLETYYDLANASILRTSSRIIKRAKAQKLFQKVIDNNPGEYKLVKYSLLNLCDLLLDDLKVSKNEDVFQKVEHITQKLENMAKRQHSSVLLVKTYLLKSKLALINLDLETAQYLLAQAEVTANENELYKLAIRVSNEQDSLINRLNKFDTLKKRNASLIERVEAVDIHETIDELLTRRQQQVLDKPEENPLFLLLLNNDALTLYSKKFEKNIEINEKLIGGFLMATDFGIGKALDNSGSIERIKYGQYNLIFMKLQSITFCYGFEGQSYFAIQRLNGFINRIQLGRSWQLLTAKNPRPKQIKKELESKVFDFFLSESMFSTNSD